MNQDVTVPCSGMQPGAFLLASVLTCGHQGRNISLCLLSEEVLLQRYLLVAAKLWFEKDLLSAVT